MRIMNYEEIIHILSKVNKEDTDKYIYLMVTPYDAIQDAFSYMCPDVAKRMNYEVFGKIAMEYLSRSMETMKHAIIPLLRYRIHEYIKARENAKFKEMHKNDIRNEDIKNKVPFPEEEEKTCPILGKSMFAGAEIEQCNSSMINSPNLLLNIPDRKDFIERNGDKLTYITKDGERIDGLRFIKIDPKHNKDYPQIGDNGYIHGKVFPETYIDINFDFPNSFKKSVRIFEDYVGRMLDIDYLDELSHINHIIKEDM